MVWNVVGSHPDVAEAAVLGLPHDRWNEAITPFLIPTDNGDLTEDEYIN
jgi:acyl-CoA synthetase (AMP-forming)/AMP-acid ligase II